MSAEDRPLDAPRSALANVYEHAEWCERKAAELEPLVRASAYRPLSPAETKELVLTTQQLLRRSSQQFVFLAFMVPTWVWMLGLIRRIRGGRGR